MITTVTGRNQVTVPAAIAAEADVRPGTRLEWSLEEEGVLRVRILPDRASVAAALRGRGRQLRQRSGSAVEALVAERAAELEGG